MNRTKTYERLSEESRNSRRTVADVLEVLRESAGFTDADRATINIGLLQLPSGDIVGLVQIFFEAHDNEKVFIVSLPTSAQFQAKRPGSSQRELFEIERLDGAVVDGAGNISLTDGVTLRAVEVVPARLPLEPSELDWRIIHQAISVLGEEGRCYRNLANGLPAPFRDMVPASRVLDCSTLSDLPVGMLKEIAYAIAGTPGFENVSHQKISDALKKFGIRRPTPRPRRG
jgi:hypothetical protein